MRKAKRKKKKKKKNELKNRERKETKRKKSGEERKKKEKRKKEKKVIGGKSDLTRQVGPIYECLITKILHNSVFHNLKTSKMRFQFP